MRRELLCLTTTRETPWLRLTTRTPPRSRRVAPGFAFGRHATALARAVSGSVGREACAARVPRTSLLERPQESNSMDMSHRICMPSLAISQPGSTRQRAVWIRSQMYRVPTPPRHDRNAPRQLTSPVTSRPHRHQCMSTVGGRIHICIRTPCRMRDESVAYMYVSIFLIEPLTRWPQDAQCDVAAEAPVRCDALTTAITC